MKANQPIQWTQFAKGDLKSKTLSYNLIDSSHDQQFCDMQVITLKQHLYQLATNQAHKNPVDFTDLDSYIESWLYTYYHSAREFVHITENLIIVGVNRPKIDNRAINYATKLLFNVESFEPGTFQTFGSRNLIYDNKQATTTNPFPKK